MKISTKLFLFIAALGLACVFFTAGAIYDLNRNFFVLNIKYDHELIVARSASEIALYLDRYREDLKLIAALMGTLKWDQWTREIALRLVGAYIVNFRDIALVDSQGTEVLAAVPRTAPRNFAKDPIVKEALAGKTAYSKVHFDRLNMPTLFMATPVKRRGEIVGAVWGQLELKQVWYILERIKPSAQSLAYIVDRDGRALSRDGVSRARLPRLSAKASYPDSEILSWEATYEGRRYLVSSMKIPGINWSIFLLRPHREVYQFFYKSLRLAIILTGFISAVACVAALFYTKKFVRPIKTIRDGARRLASGDLSHRVKVESRDELGELAQAFNGMASDLERYLERLVKKTEQEAHQKNLTVLGTTASKVTHQVENFLNNMSLGLSNLKMGGLDDSARKTIEVMERNIASLQSFITSFMAFARKPQMKVTFTDLRQELQFLVQTHATPGFSVRLHYQPPENGNFVVECDPAQLGQAFSCILKNALEAQQGNGAMDIRVKDLRDQVELAFRDYGPGIEADDPQRVFEPFFTTKGKKGTGLGLALVKNIVEAHAGRITVESTRGQGTVFTVTLPKKFGLGFTPDKDGGVEQ